MIIYRIKNKEGKYSAGGYYPNFTKKGKIWKNIGHVKLHIQQLCKKGLQIYDGCTLETMEIKEECINSEPMQNLIINTLLIREERDKNIELKLQQEKYIKEKKLYEDLKRKFEK